MKRPPHKGPRSTQARSAPADKSRSSSPKQPRVKPTRREIKYHGWHACLALWQQRPADVIRIYLTEARLKGASKLLSWAASNRLAYHVVDDDELERVTETHHHQGICVLAYEHPRMNFQTFVGDAAESDKCLAVYLDGLGNPHNTGAILRTLAFFGVRYVLGDSANRINLAPSTCRVAEGGAEFVNIVDLETPAGQLELLKKRGFVLATSDVKKGHSLARYTFPPRTLLILGNEELGVTPAIARLADAVLRIEGGGNVESLNVSAAAALFVSAYFRQHSAG